MMTGLNGDKFMKATYIIILPSLFILTACATKNQSTSITIKEDTITTPAIIKAPDFSKLSAKGCQGGERIYTTAVLKLNKQGDVTDVYGLDLANKALAKDIASQFKKAKYTPYKHNGVPIAKNLIVSISLQCPK